MYPAGYTLGPQAFEYSKRYMHAAPHYTVQVPRALVGERQPFLQHRHVVVKPIQYAYAPHPSPQPSSRMYRYDQGVYSQHVPDILPKSPATADRPFPEAASKWSWESPGSQVYAPPPPLESLGSFPEVGLRTVSTLPENTPRDGYFSTGLPKIVEVVRIEGGVGPAKPSDKYVPKPAGDVDFAESEGEDEADDNREREGRKTTTHTDTRAEEGEKREATETSREEEQDALRNETSSTNEKEEEVQEGEKHAEDQASSEATSELMSREEPPFTDNNQPGEEKEDVKGKEEEGERTEGLKEEEKEAKEGFGNQMDDEPQMPGEIGSNIYGKNFKVKFDTQISDECLKHFPMFSLTTASTFSGIDLMTTPRLGEIEGEVFQASNRGPKFEASDPTPTNWPIGYVPPPDQKYKKLVVGNQVYYEGGAFYLSETGAYLLGLRG
ncbi:hypothetical protein Esti_004304 [Eimeria stiedai]